MKLSKGKTDKIAFAAAGISTPSSLINLFERDEDGNDEKNERDDERVWQHERYEKTYECYGDEKRIKQVS